MKRIQRGPVRGISFKLQEEERERKDQYVPEVSALDFTQSDSGQLEVDTETKDLLKSLGVSVIAGLWVNSISNITSSSIPSQSTLSQSLNNKPSSVPADSMTALNEARRIMIVGKWIPRMVGKGSDCYWALKLDGRAY